MLVIDRACGLGSRGLEVDQPERPLATRESLGSAVTSDHAVERKPDEQIKRPGVPDPRRRHGQLCRLDVTINVDAEVPHPREVLRDVRLNLGVGDHGGAGDVRLGVGVDTRPEVGRGVADDDVMTLDLALKTWAALTARLPLVAIRPGRGAAVGGPQYCGHHAREHVPGVVIARLGRPGHERRLVHALAQDIGDRDQHFAGHRVGVVAPGVPGVDRLLRAGHARSPARR